MSATLIQVMASAAGAPLLLLVKATLLVGLALVATLLLRRRSAAARHLVWTLTMAMLLVLPVAAWLVPDLRLAIVSVPAEAAAIWESPGEGSRESLAEGSGAVRVGEERSIAGVPVPSGAKPSPGTAGQRADSSPRAAFTPATLVTAWKAGAAAVLCWLLLGHAALHFVRRRAQPLTGAGWGSALHDARWMLDVDRPVRLYRSRSAAMPVTWGVLRPVVLLPEAAEAWSEERRRVVLLHELSHIARQDCLTQLVAVFACALWWFHPGVWYAARRMRIEREHACDDRVLAAGTSAPDYASHLLALAQHFRASVRAPLVALYMARPSQLEGRLLCVLAGASHRSPPTRGAVAAAALAMLLVTLPLSALQPGVREHHVASTVPLPDAVEQSDGEAPGVQDSTVQYTVMARSGERLMLDLRTGGSVEIAGWDESSVRVRGVLAGPDRGESSVLVERGAGGVNVVAWQRGSRPSYSTSHRFEISVPRQYDIELSSAGGDVVIRAVSGTFRGHTGGGGIVLSELSGEAQLTTGGGDVRVTDSQLAGRITTGAGDVTLRNVSGGLRGSSGNGRVTADSPARGAPERTMPSAGTSTRSRGGSSSVTINGDSVVSISRRMAPSEAAFAITTRDGRVALMLRDTSILLQYTDRGLDALGRDDLEKEGEDNFLAALVSSMLRGGLRMVLDRAIEYSLYDLREARYQDGRLVFESRRGGDVFADTNINGGPLMEQFSERDGRAFARRVNAARGRLTR